MSLIVIFVDGVGIGSTNPEVNPCLNTIQKIFSPQNSLPFSGKKNALDACLDTHGLPQSATGQTTIYTGKNAAKVINKHLFGFPNAKLIELIQSDSIFVRLIKLGFSCNFINAFRPVFFTTPELFINKRLSATSEMNRAANLPFKSLTDIKNKKALYHDFTNSELINKGHVLPKYTALNAAKILVDQSNKYDLILYEYFLTDMAGHSKNKTKAIEQLNNIETLIYKTAELIVGTDTSLMVCSDHGNIEDLSTKSHTRNPAFWGIWTKYQFPSPESLTDISAVIMQIIKKPTAVNATVGQ